MFRSYDGWQKVEGTGSRAVLARFTKEDGMTTHYNFAALKRMKDEPSKNITPDDTTLIQKAIADGPSFLRSYNGRHNYGRGKKSIMMASFTNAAGRTLSRNLTAIDNTLTNPPKYLSQFDRVLLEMGKEDLLSVMPK